MTRSREEIIPLVEKRFEEFKTNLLDDLTADIQKIVETSKQEIQTFFDEKSRDFEQGNELANSVKLIQEHVRKLQESNVNLRKQNSILEGNIDDLEQYGRRQSLRIYGVPLSDGKTSEDVRNIVLRLISDANIAVPMNFVDRARRIGKAMVKDGVKKQGIIVRFNNFHSRTIFYRARKEIYVGVLLDLTKSRLDLLDKARDLVKNVSSVKFVYSDINCALRVLTESGKHVAFKSLDDLKKIISDF